MKINITLTGLEDYQVYEQSPISGDNIYTHGGEAPSKLVATITDEFCRFQFTDYPCVPKGDSPADHQQVWRGKFDFVHMILSTPEDISRSGWRRIKCFGRILFPNSGMERLEAFSIEIPDGSSELFVYAYWNHKRFGGYPGEKPEPAGKSTIIKLDGRSMMKFNVLWNSLQKKEHG